MKVCVDVPKTAEDMRQQIVQECRNTAALTLSNVKHCLRIRLQKRLERRANGHSFQHILQQRNKRFISSESN